MKKSILIAMVLVFVLAVPTFANPFTDVPANHWAYNAVNKLVAAGIVDGYPDGTYKGQNNMTRYEIAVIVARALDNIAAERAVLADKVEAAKAGLSSEQAQDVTAIVKALMEKNQPEPAKAPAGLTDQQADEVANLIEALTFEFKAELKTMGAKVDALGTDVADLDARVTALENAKPVVDLSGTYSVDFNHQKLAEGTTLQDIDVYNVKSGAVVEVKDDPYVYTDPWDDDSDDFTVDQDKSIEQELDAAININKKGAYNAAVNLVVLEDGDENFVFDDFSATFENSDLKAAYNESNSVTYADYAFGDTDFDGATVNFKNSGLNLFAGFVDDVKVALSLTDAKEGVDYASWDPATDTLKKKEEYYVFGANKTFDLAGFSLDATYGGTRAREEALANSDYKVNEVDVFGVNTTTDLDGIDLGFDFAHSMPVADGAESDNYFKVSASSDFDLGNVAFDYRTTGENFMPLESNDIVFDSGDSDYDVFADGAAAGTKAWKLVIKPNLFADQGIETSFKYAAANEEDVASPAEYAGDSSDIVLTAKKADLIPGLTVDGSFELYDNDGAAETEKTFDLNGEYTFNDYLTANAGYEMAKDASNLKDNEKNTFSVGADLADYPVIDALTVNAGFGYEAISGQSVAGSGYGTADKDENTVSYNLGLGYQLAKAKLTYDYTNEAVSGDNIDPTEITSDYNSYILSKATYTTQKLGLVYPVTKNANFEASYEQLLLKDDVADSNLYDVRTATAGVSFSF